MTHGHGRACRSRRSTTSSATRACSSTSTRTSPSPRPSPSAASARSVLSVGRPALTRRPNVAAPGAPAIALPGPQQPEPDPPRRRQQPAEHRPDPLPAGRPVAPPIRCASATPSTGRDRRARVALRRSTASSRSAPISTSRRPTRGRRRPPPVGGNLKVASMNVLNFFTRSTPTRAAATAPTSAAPASLECRGAHRLRARSPAGEDRQRAHRRSTPTSSG